MSSVLEKYYRQPEIYIKLPNNGEFYPEGSLELPEGGEVPVYAMTAKDDIILKTPDALMSGEAVVKVIKSCVPAIVDPWLMPVSDVDYVLIAIRIASYGNDMDLEFKCEKCEHEFNVSVDLGHYIETLGNINVANEGKTIQYGEIKVHIKPLSYTDLSLLQRKTFEEQQAIQAMGDLEDRPQNEKQELYNKVLNTMTDININTISSGVESIELPDGALVTDKEEIVQFVNNSTVKLFNQITKAIESIRRKTELDPIDVVCPECTHEFKSPLMFDYAHFFE